MFNEADRNRLSDLADHVAHACAGLHCSAARVGFAFKQPLLFSDEPWGRPRPYLLPGPPQRGAVIGLTVIGLELRHCPVNTVNRAAYEYAHQTRWPRFTRSTREHLGLSRTHWSATDSFPVFRTGRTTARREHSIKNVDVKSRITLFLECWELARVAVSCHLCQVMQNAW